MKALIYSVLMCACLCMCANFIVNTTAPTSKFNHFWEECVGSGHAVLALREDYRKHLKLAKDELGFKYVRFHGLFDDDMSTVHRPGDFSKYKYSFFNIDSIFDYLLSIDMKPLIELSFMPEALASGNATVMHYKGNITPPKDHNAWADLIIAFATHLLERYGNQVLDWPFEVWNEPNLENTFWTGTQQEYFYFYAVTARALKSVNSKLKVGGPATAGSGWIPEFLKYTRDNSVPVDFVSTHEYPTDTPPDERNQLEKITKKTREAVGNLPLYYTEWNCGLVEYGQGDVFYQDSSYAAPCIISNLARVSQYVDIFSYWTFSDIFEEQGMPASPHHGAFGMMTKYGTRKAAWNAFILLHKAGNQRIKVSGQDDTVDLLATVNDKNEVMMFLSNYDVLHKDVPDKAVTVTIIGARPSTSNKVKLTRIDANHASTYEHWVRIGKPEYPTREQLAELGEASKLTDETLNVIKIENGFKFDVKVPAYGVAAIQYSKEN